MTTSILKYCYIKKKGFFNQSNEITAKFFNWNICNELFLLLLLRCLWCSNESIDFTCCLAFKSSSSIGRNIWRVSCWHAVKRGPSNIRVRRDLSSIVLLIYKKKKIHILFLFLFTKMQNKKIVKFSIGNDQIKLRNGTFNEW